MMEIFTTREIAILIYAILLLAYILIRKKGKNILLPVIKAACHIKLIIPFCLILIFAIGFIFGCTYLPFWNWIYVKDIVFWILFAGVPICFNATSRQLEEHYFKNILVDNFKFTVLVEFITGTFTFHIISELILQPFLVLLLVLQSSIVKKNDATKKIVDTCVGITGLVIFGFIIKSIVNSIDDIQFVDVIVSLLLPIILSVLYLPVSYFFAVYAKYEIVFAKMDFKEPDDKKLRRKHRIEVIRCCKFSYKKICRFLNEYIQKMYVRMNSTEFETLLNEFRGTTEHTYVAVIKHNGKYYVNRTFNGKYFKFDSYTINKGGLFNSANKELRKEIALQIQQKTAFKNTDYINECTHYPVSLKKMFLFSKGAFFKRTKIAIFLSNVHEKRNCSVELPFNEDIKEQSDQNTLRLMRVLKWTTLWSPFLAVLIYFLLFLILSVLPVEIKINLDLTAFIFACISLFRAIFNNKKVVFKGKIGRIIMHLKEVFTCCGIQELFMFIISLFIGHVLQPVAISSSTLSKLGIAFLFLDVLIDILKREQ